MAGNRAGGLKAAKTNQERWGDDFYSKLGRKGGRKRSPKKGFGSDRKRASIAGIKGGKASKRGKALE